MAQEKIADSDIYAAAMRAGAGIGWRRTRLADIAEEAGLSLADLHARYTSKEALLDGFVRHIDRIVLTGAQQSDDEDSSYRDRLFDILMQRFDALNPYKDGLRAVVRDAGSGGVAEILCGGCRLLRSMRWMLEAAGIGTAGWLGGLRVKGLAVVFAATLNVWLRDDSEDMAKTMAALDRNLKRAEQFATMRSPFGRRHRGEDVPDPDAEPAPAT
ncbi:MAG: helix-turn-helix domain containing protein [Rhodospirillaceae bacterium]|nr:helix-turn-helix domain containing protein [Rhodospirillaceae bacterium]